MADRTTGHPLTTAGGVPVADNDHSLRAGTRGPGLLQDHHLREKITHFDHERIPERVVHARGAGAHGHFESYGSASRLTCAQFLQPGVVTPVFVRFSTFVGSRGSADTVRDTRGFATKFYTAEGTFDLVGNDIPVFFIQDAMRFPDVVHALKPRPDVEIPQAASAHDTFWDFVSRHTEAQHHTMWVMSDRGIPRSYRTMEGFGVHTFRLVADDGATNLVKWHWKPKAGVHSLVWDEARLAAGLDPDFHRRDLARAIDAGALPQWELGVQVFPDNPEQEFEGVDLLDPSKFVPEELAPVHAVGLLTLDRNPTDYFAETEQVAFNVGSLVRGIDVTDDPLLQGRLFSYLDAQVTRLGGPNFTQLPVNRPHAPVDDSLRDGMHQGEVRGGAATLPTASPGGGCPVHAVQETAFIDVPVPVHDEGAAPVKERRAPASFADHFSQPRMFWRSLSPVERAHIAAAYAYELGRCTERQVQERQLQALANIDPHLCEAVAAHLGLAPPEPTVELRDGLASRALSQLGRTWPVAGRVVGVVVDDATDAGQVSKACEALLADDVTPLVLAPTLGEVAGGCPVDRSWLTATSVELDAVLLLTGAPLVRSGGPATDATATGRADDRGMDGLRVDPRVVALTTQAYRHCKPIAALPDGLEVLAAAHAEAWAAGITTADDTEALVSAVVAEMGGHRCWDRFPVPA